MALADRVKDAYVSKSGSPCSVGAALENLPPDELSVFVNLLGTQEKHGAVASYIFALCRDERQELLTRASEARSAEERDRLLALADAYDVKYQQINKHRGKRCRCEQGAA